MTSSFFSGRSRAEQTSPHVELASVGVNVTVTEREAGNDGIEWAPDAKLAERIRADLPNAGTNKPDMGTSLTLARHAAVLKQEAEFLTDTGHKVPPPDQDDLIAALRFAADQLFDSVVIA